MKSKRKILVAIILSISLIAWLAKSIMRTSGTSAKHNYSPSQQSGTFRAEQATGSVEINVELGEPTDADAEDDVVIKRSQYVVSYNPQTHNPNWVSWNLSAWWYGSAQRHKGQFIPDPDLGEEYFHTLHRDYVRSGFDRGHMCRSDERTRNDEDNLTTFYTTNIIPQYHELNAGPWLRFEDYCKELCLRDGKELYIVAGPIYSRDEAEIGRGVRIPSGCFKIAVVLEKGKGIADVNSATTVIAVKMPNSRDVEREDWRNFECSVRDVERATGYNFLNRVPKNIQDQIETTVAKLPS